MRIAIVNWTRYQVGGAETYLHTLLPDLERSGHSVSLLCEVSGPADREPIGIPAGAPLWSVADLGERMALEELARWQPDVLFVHGLLDPLLEERILRTAPAVLFAHNYYGTCISGEKTTRQPRPAPCSRRFGAACLLHFYPHRCGGWSPLMMVRQYRKQSRRLALLSRYSAVVTASEHMRTEIRRHGIPPERVVRIGLPVRAAAGARVPSAGEPPLGVDDEVRLLFSGRMDLMKGGHYLLEALPLVRRALARPVRLIMAGDGPRAGALAEQALRVQSCDPGVVVDFRGWIPGGELAELYSGVHLLVMPSIWPEPFGLSGVEAGCYGIPTAAFDVGGISDWLTAGFSGHLAAGDPPTPAGLAGAIVRCLEDPAEYGRLRMGALAAARRFAPEAHTAAVLEVLGRAAGGTGNLALGHDTDTATTEPGRVG